MKRKVGALAAVVLIACALVGCKVEQHSSDDPPKPNKVCGTEFISPFNNDKVFVYTADPRTNKQAWILAARTVTECDFAPAQHVVTITFLYSETKNGVYHMPLGSPVDLTNGQDCSITKDRLDVWKPTSTGVAAICDFWAPVCKVGYWKAQALITGYLGTDQGLASFADTRLSGYIKMTSCPKHQRGVALL